MGTIIKIATGKQLPKNIPLTPFGIAKEKDWIRRCIAERIIESTDELVRFYIDDQNSTIEGSLFVEITEEQEITVKANNPNFL